MTNIRFCCSDWASLAIRGCFLAFLVAIGLSPASAAGASDADSIPRGLVGHWRFDRSDGRTVSDRSPKGNDGLIEFGRLCQEKAGASLELDGLGGSVRIRETEPLEFPGGITAAIWIKPARWRDKMVLFGVPNPTESWTTPAFGMYAEGERVVYGLWLERGSAKTLVESSTAIPLDTWTFLAGTYDGRLARLYVNGHPVAEKETHGRITRSGQPLILGAGRGTKPSFKGRIGELLLFDRALDAEEVLSLCERTGTAYDRTESPQKSLRDGTVIVETHGNRPEGNAPWRPRPTRLLELLDGFQPSSEPVKVNRFGGRTDMPAEKATGFFWTKKIDGRHWLIDPQGRRFFHVGMNSVREPRNVEARFGSADRWAEAVTAQLRQSGFNGLGNWHSSRLNQVEHPLVWVLRKNFMFEFAREKKLTEPAAGTVGFLNRCMPVFHPEFPDFCERYGEDLADTAGDPYLLGIMTDNELQCPSDLLDRYLSLDPNDPNQAPGRNAAAAWLSNRKGSVDTKTLNVRDRYEFIAFAFDRYYEIVTKVIRKYDPNHLYLGSRINYRTGQFDNPWFWKALARYHDVVSVNYYNAWGADAAQFAEWEAWAGRPILLTEWYAKAMDVPGLANRLGAGWLVRTQEDRGRYYQHFALAALETPNVVGWHWFKYLDDPAESKALDSAGGANKGMFNHEGQPYQPLLDRADAVNRQVYRLIDFFESRQP